MKKIIVIALCSCLYTFMMSSCSQTEEDTYSHHADLNPVEYHELSNIEYQEENTSEIIHHFREGYTYSGTDSK